jgi:O-methyltransferase involved in polyketide biosynthesis
MAEKITLDGVAETLLITLYLRALESQRPDALLKDEKAVALVTRLNYDFAWIKQIPMGEIEKTTLILRTCEFDRYTRNFLTRHPQATAVHIGCGFDTRFERVDDGKAEWYDLDFPDVIELRRRLIGHEGGRYHLLGCSVLDDAWLEMVQAHHPGNCPFLFLAEGVSMYLEEAQIKTLVLTLRDHFPGSELVFDAFSPFHIWRSNLQISIAGLRARFPRLRWGLWCGQEVEAWGDGIRLLDDWGYLDRPDPRLAHFRWMRHIPLVSRAGRIYHFKLGKDR